MAKKLCCNISIVIEVDVMKKSNQVKIFKTNVREMESENIYAMIRKKKLVCLNNISRQSRQQFDRSVPGI